jgi:hypothetical protein
MNLGFKIFFSFLSVLVLLVIFKDTTMSSTLTIFVVIASIMIYNQSSSINKIELTEYSISFINTIYKKEKTFSYDEITEFKSVINIQQGLSYNTIDITFGNKFSTTLFETEYDDFDKLKLFLHSKVK